MGLVAFKDQIKNQNLSIYCDNQAVVYCFKNMGAKDIMLSRKLFRIIQFCHDNNVRINVRWIGTKDQLADGISRELNVNESKLRPKLRQLVVQWFNPNMDLFASTFNRLTSSMRFCSFYPEEQADCLNALAYKIKPGDRLYMFPPFSLRKIVKKAIIDKVIKRTIMLVNNK